jgi:thiamine-phosphate pyrophosphorylase
MGFNCKSVNYSLYLVTDRSLSRGRATSEIVASAIKGGVSCVQLREKKLGTRDFINEAKVLNTLLFSKGIPLIINDRVDVALAVKAAGVHLGQSDMSIRDARYILGSTSIIGVSAECLEDAVIAEKQGADYIAISPVFSTTTKTDTAPPLGLAGIQEIRQQVSLPLVAIGGINRENCSQVITSGADGIAVVSAIVSAPSPEHAALELGKIINKARGITQ